MFALYRVIRAQVRTLSFRAGGIVFALLPFFLPACGGRFPAAGGEAVFHAGRDDGELALIALRARDTLPVFLDHCTRPGIGEKDFRVKYPFQADRGSGFAREQLWLGKIRVENGVYSGEVLNVPFHVSGLSKGDRVDFDTAEITDWMFIRRGRIEGGLSIRYLLERIPPGERSGDQQAVLSMFE